MTYGKGYIQDPPEHQRTSFAKHAAGAAPENGLAVDVDNRPNAPPVKDQNGCSGCTGHGTSGAVSLTCRSKGAPLPFEPSEKGIYDVARAIDRHPNADNVLPPLVDAGAMPNQVMRGIEEWGVRPRGQRPADGRESDCDPATINDEPTLAELEQAATRLLIGDYAIGLFDRVDLTKRAIAAGIGVGVGFDVDQACEDYSGGAPLTTPGPSLSGHWVYLVGYRTDRATGKTIFLGRNSWGVGWGGPMRGDFEATEEWLLSAFQIIALDVKAP